MGSIGSYMETEKKYPPVSSKYPMASTRTANLPPALDWASIIIVLAPGSTFEARKAGISEGRRAIHAICCLVEDTPSPYEVHNMYISLEHVDKSKACGNYKPESGPTAETV